MVTIIAPAMGIAVRFTRSKEETPPIPEDTTITAVIGEQLRMIEAAKCTARRRLRDPECSCLKARRAQCAGRRLKCG